MTRRLTIHRRALLAATMVGGLTLSTPASAQLEPQIRVVSPDVVEQIRQEEAMTLGRPIEEMELPAADIPEVRTGAAGQRMLPADDSSAHYARGNTLVLHVFIDHAGGTWTEAARDVARGRSQVAKDYYVANAPAGANKSFSPGDAWYNTYVEGTITEITGDQILEALANIGWVDTDGDGWVIDDLSIWLQGWNGGYDNVFVCIEPYSNGRAWAGYGEAITVLYLNSDSNVWEHEWGHLFGACDEYEEGGVCNGGLDCDICQSTYLTELVPNFNCEITTCGIDIDCMMKNYIGICPYTLRHWAWVDDDSNGQLNNTRRRVSGSTFVTIWEIWHNGWFYWNDTSQSEVMAQRWNSWSVAGIRSPAGADYDIALYGDNNHNYLLASTGTSRKVDFIVGDYNHSNLGNEHIQVSRYSGNTDGYNLTFESGDEMLYPDGVVRTASWNDYNVVRVYDVPLFAGETVSFWLDETSGAVDLGMALFKSNGDTYFDDQFGAEWERDATGAGGSEFYSYSVPADDVYGLVIWSNNAANGQYDIQIGPAPLTLLEEQPYSINWDLDLYNYTPNAWYWEFAGTRPDPGTNVELAISDDSTYEVLEERSREYASGQIEFIASDYLNGYSTDYLRVNRTAGSGSYTTNWEHDEEILSGFVGEDWVSPVVGKIWDVWMGGGQQYFFRQYNTTPTLDGGIYVFDSSDGDIRKARAQTAAASNFRDPSQLGEWFEYTAPVDDWYGYSMIVNNEDSGGFGLMHGPKITMAQSVPTSWFEPVVWTEVPITEAYWQVVGMRLEGTDEGYIAMWDCDGYGLECYLQTDGNRSGVVFIVSDHLHAPVQTHYARGYRTVGSGAIDLSHEAGMEEIIFDPNGVVTPETDWAMGEVVQIWDFWIDGSGPGGQEVEVVVDDESGNLDLGVALFDSGGNPVYQGSLEAVASADDAGVGEIEIMTFTVNTADWFGLVVYNNNDSGGTYDIHVREPGTVDVGDVAGGQIRPFGLKALSPNPYMGPVTLELSLEEAGLADLAIYDVQGRLVRHLVSGRQNAGVHRVAWDGRDQFGRSLGSGVYVARLQNGKAARSVKLVRTR